MRIKAVIFDLDGTLLDTERLFSECLIDAASDKGWKLDMDIVIDCIGTTVEETERIVCKTMGGEFPYNEVKKSAEDKFRAHIDQNGIPFKNGAHRLFNCLDEQNIPFSIATTTERKDVDTLLGIAGIMERFSTIVCGDEVLKGKPDPEIYRKAADIMGVTANETLVFEDSAHGIQAAAAFGARVIWVPDIQQISEDDRKKCYDEIGSLDAVSDRLEELIV
jgi:beta-phosphoglucomutase-like phosphatase (HAD superfamily)